MTCISRVFICFVVLKTLNTMPEPYKSRTEIASFHTVSKGAYGECGLRGGYMELHNMCPRLADEIYKVCSINLCPNVPGQVALGLMLNPPKPGDFSYEQFRAEKDGVLESLKRRARMITDAFNSLEGVTCQETDGAMYSFPQITLPPAFIAKAKKMGKEPDTLYCLELLDETGLSCVPGSGFKQAPGTFHLRTTILVRSSCVHLRTSETPFSPLLHLIIVFSCASLFACVVTVYSHRFWTTSRDSRRRINSMTSWADSYRSIRIS